MVNSFYIRQIIKSIIFSYARSMMIILAIFISTIVSSAFLNIYFDIDTKISKELKAYGANVNIIPKNEYISNQSFKDLKTKLNHTLTPYFYNFLNADGLETLVLGTDFAAIKLTKPFIELREGSFALSDFDDNSVFLGISVAKNIIAGNKQNSLKNLIGKELELTSINKTKKLKIKGIIESNDELDGVILAPLKIIQELSNIYNINYANAIIDGDFDTINKKAAMLNNDDISVNPISSVSFSEELILNKLKALMFLIIIIVLIIASTSVNTTLSSIIFARKKEVALHLALGAKKKDIIKLFGLECVTLALFASIVGALSGYFLANLFGYIIFDSGIEFRFKSVIIAIAISMIFAILAAFLPIKRALNINMCENLKGE